MKHSEPEGSILPDLADLQDRPEMRAMIAEAYAWAARTKEANVSPVGKWAQIRATLGAMEVGEHIMLPIPAGYIYQQFQNNLRGNLTNWRETIDFKWSIKKSQDGTRASIIKIALRGDVDVPENDEDRQTSQSSESPQPSSQVDGLLVALKAKQARLLKELDELELAIESTERVMKLLASTSGA